MGGQSVRRHTCVSTKKAPCTAAATGAPWTSFVAAVDEVAHTPPGRISIFPVWCSDIRHHRIREIPGYGFPDQIPPLEKRGGTDGMLCMARCVPRASRTCTPSPPTRATAPCWVRARSHLPQSVGRSVYVRYKLRYRKSTTSARRRVQPPPTVSLTGSCQTSSRVQGASRIYKGYVTPRV